MKKIALLLTLISAMISFIATSVFANDKIIVGATPVPCGEVLSFIKDKMKARGVDLVVKEFSDYVTPNLALEDGSLDANFFQHVPYLKVFSEQHKITDIIQFGEGVLVTPMLGASYVYNNINDIKEGDSIVVPNDPTNEARALLLLHNNGLITLKDANNTKATIQDIAANPKKLKIKEVEAPQIPHVIMSQDVQFGVINVNYALQGKMDFSKVLIKEDKKSIYILFLAIKESRKNDKNLQILNEVLHSADVRDFINKKYNGTVVPTF